MAGGYCLICPGLMTKYCISTMDNLLPEIPSSPIFKDSSSDDEAKIQPGQKSPKKQKEPDHIRLDKDTYKKVKEHSAVLIQLQSTLISLTTEIKRLDNQLTTGTVPRHLQVQRNLPKLPGSLHCTEELRDSWNSLLLKAGKRLGQAWRQELSRQAKRQKERYQEKEERALADLDNEIQSVEAKRLLNHLLKKSSQKTETKIAHRHKKSERRHHPYRRKVTATRSQLNAHNLNEKVEESLKYVKNLSERQLSNLEIIALSKGLKFITTPEKPNRIDILKSMKDLTRKMRIRYVMQNKMRGSFTKFRLPSTWSPQVTYSRDLEDYLEATKEELAAIPISNAKSNISKAERIALRQISKDRTIVLKPFDKGRGIAILNRTDYKADLERQLKSHHYQELEGDITSDTKIMVWSTLRNICFPTRSLTRILSIT
ncbi:hypothetical protein HOLleu_02419 [Holothuria leucospilota]|uniref:Uncharacterized protein n=1 Tax=Holothuria leucospilota TaxID=206669 RepID=A0A9Q1CPL3_HOLLE|nr:hypothetical protein HOLleu_02419 [Holothuria leucospilota]